ncbi:Ig-like domain-containing protein [Pseudochryseolinea flava]|uniref:glucan endo-1,3-beta-D-glucosidase n=1 Tax=Pseudochryseolinea flava TaxID=2059302 RepID=A0A364Y0M9_9BACT|nr:Ig-like domain-containing protein [Pseudochryseolinea flava]RAV99462.1 endo-1,3(4)-beta-glucanase [Pseudochryseolinea flava]
MKTELLSLISARKGRNYFVSPLSVELLNPQLIISAVVFVLLSLSLMFDVVAQVTSVGSGSYTSTFPGTDAAGRNTYPTGSPGLSGAAASKPVPTNDWWSNFVKNSHGGQAFNYPLSYKSVPSGIVVNLTVPPGAGPSEYRQPMGDVNAIVVGVDGLNATQSTAADHTDWTVTMNWNAGGKNFNALMGIGMPFTYFTKGSSDLAKVVVNHNPSGASISGNKIIITNTYNGANFVVFGPAGTVWSGSNGVYTSNLNGKNYWSMAMLPTGVDVNTAINNLAAYAYVFPSNTAVAWNYTASTGALRTTFTVTPDVKEGSANVVLQGLLPHQWSRLAAGSPTPAGYTYNTVRGQLKMLASNSFIVENKFSGILPTLPNLAKYSGGFDPGALYKKIDIMKNDGLAEWTDSYNEGQGMNRLIQAAHLAHQIGHIEARDKLINTVKARLEDWFKAEGGEVAFLFYYNNTWKSLIGYPAGHRQDENLNDHHFHWGYFIHAAAAIEQYQPGWASQWGGMVDLLIRDASNPSRTDSMFPFLRNFSPYAGHCWANGFATEPFGNDQESTSESMQFNSSLIHWGTVTGNNAIRDLGIYLYTTEQSAVEEYWFDQNDRTFQPAYAHEMVARIWGAGYDNGTWWTSDIAASYGIQLYPIHGGALYMGQNTAYVQKVWDGMKAKTQVLNNTPNDNLWYDTYWSFLSFLDPQQAINLYNAYPNRSIKFGISDGQTYHWLHTMNAMGQVAEEVTANYPIAAVFNKAGVKTYVAYNYGASTITVNFSDGYSMSVPSKTMVTNRDIAVTVSLSSNTTQVPTNGTINLTASTTGSGITKVEFYRDGTLIGTDTSSPYTLTTQPLAAGLPNFHARAYVGTNHNVSNVVAVQAGSQVPYGGTATAIPGTIEAGNYDAFEGGSGQGVSYSDATSWNEGNYRTSEAVDAGTTTSEGVTVGWIDAGEWLEYTVNVATAGNYNVTLRYTSGNTAGGGPFWFENAAGTKITPDITVAFNDTNWSTYVNKVVNNVSLAAGQQVIRVKVGNGGFNLGRMTFAFAGGTPPTVSITSPANNTSFTAPGNITINATASDSDGSVSKVEFFNGSTKLGEDTSSPYSFAWTNVSSGTYALSARATDNGSLTATSSTVNVTVSNNAVPSVSISSPSNGATFNAPASITINANASDTDGTISKVEFYNGATKLGEDTTSPYSFAWTGVAAGTYSLAARAIDNGNANSTSSVVNVTVNGGGTGCSGNGPNAPSTSTPDYTWQASNSANPTITFVPGSPISGTTMVILYYKIGTGGYIGVNMDPSGSNYTKSFTAPSGSAIAMYFTYRVGATMAERNSSATPHSFTVGQCSGGNISPTVNLTSPTNGASFTAPASITINATAADSDGTVSKVEFYNGTTKLGEDTSSPYSYTWTSVAAGSYSLTARAVDNASATTTSSSVSVTVTSSNVLPTAAITSPTNGATFSAPASITINATATDSDGTVSKVEFYNGSTKLGEDTSSPYSYTWTNVAAGTYSLTARSTDNLGATRTSTAVSVTVNGVSVCTGNGPTQSGQSVADYSYEISTSGNVNVKFIPKSPINGCDLAIFYYRIGTGGYAGYMMTASAGNFTTSVSIPSGSNIQFYFTYRRSAGGMESNSAATPHGYTVGSTCSARVATTVESETFDMYPNPVSHELYVSGLSGNQFSIINANGSKMREEIATSDIVNVSSYNAGIYMLVITKNNQRFVQRFVKK